MPIADEEVRRLESIAKTLRRHIVTMIGHGTPGHLGGSCSIADVIAVLYFHKMRYKPSDPKWPERDRLLLSKGHCVLAQYAALAELGCIPMESLRTLKVLGSILQGHPEIDRTPGIEAYTGSLGQGLSIACGMAMAAKIDKRDYRIYCILGDGEIDEGQVWPASMTAVVPPARQPHRPPRQQRPFRIGTDRQVLRPQSAGGQMAGLRLARDRDRRARHPADCRRAGRGRRPSPASRR